MSQNTLNKSSVMLNDLIGGLEYCWHFILKFDTEIISFLNNEQMLKVIHLLLANMTSNVDNFNKWIEILHKSDLQENKRLIIFILTCVFTQIGYLITESTTKSISKCFNAVCINILSIFKYILYKIIKIYIKLNNVCFRNVYLKLKLLNVKE